MTTDSRPQSSIRLVLWIARIVGAAAAAFYLWIAAVPSEDSVPGTEPIGWMAVLTAMAVAVGWRRARAGGILTVLAGVGLWASVLAFGEPLVPNRLLDAAITLCLFGVPFLCVGCLFLLCSRELEPRRIG